MRGRRALGAAVVAVAVSVTAGCSSLPTSGPVMEGSGGGDRQGIVIVPRGPAPGVGPLELVRGFLGAGVGAEESFAAARAYLAPASGTRWEPRERVVVTAGVEVSLGQAGEKLPDDARVDPAAGPVTATVSARAVAVVDVQGRYRVQPPGEVASEDLRVVLADGQWRLDTVPDQLFIDQDDFDRSWSARSLYFPDPSGAALVPEVRWFPPLLDALPTAVATELLRGPSPWLAPAVRPTATPRPRLSSASVTVAESIAEVDLRADVLDAGIDERGLLVASLDATLSALPGITGVEVTAGGGLLSGITPDAPPQASPTVSPSLVVVRDGAMARRLVLPRAGALVPRDEGALAAVPTPLGDDLAGDLSHPAVSGEQDSSTLAYAALVGRGSGTTTLVRWGQGAVGRPVVQVQAPATLTAPAFDPQGWLWTAATSGDAGVSAVPRAGRAVAVDAPWLAGRTIVALQPSREGARALVVSSVPGEDGDRVDVVGIRRGADGTPEALVEPDEDTVPQVGEVVAAAWVDQSTVAVVGTATRLPAAGEAVQPDGPGAYRQVFVVTGGTVEPLGAPGLFDRQEGDPSPPEVVSVAARDGATTLLLGAADGRVYQRAGVRWLPDRSLDGSTDPSFPG